MPSEKEIAIITKAAVFDLIHILDKTPDKTYTTEEIKQILTAYAVGTDQ